MRHALVGLILLVGSACSTQPAGPTAASAARSNPSTLPTLPTPSPAVSPSGVLAVMWFDDRLMLYRSDGHLVASVATHPIPWRPNLYASWTSATRTRLYYLDGGTQVRSLAPDGTRAAVTDIPRHAFEQSGFSVSPDDRRIAVAVMSYTPNADSSIQPRYDGMRLYVEDLRGHGHHIQIFSSSTVAEYPIGWVGGNLVMAVSRPYCCRDQAGTLVTWNPYVVVNPYAASEYHVVDPATGARLATLCPNSYATVGPVEPFGTACWKTNGPPTFQRWDGTPFPAPAPMPSPIGYLVASSPTGDRLAVGGDQIRIMGPGGAPDQLLPVRGYPYGWLDDHHLVYSIWGENQAIDLQSGTIANLYQSWVGMYLGTLPASIS